MVGMENKALDKIMGIILILGSLFLPIIMILTNKEILVNYSLGFTMGAMFVAGVMMFK